MDPVVQETCVVKELEIVMHELLFAHLRLEGEGDQQRAMLVRAQIILCGEILGVYQRNTDWDDFIETLEDYAWSETERYREARENGDRLLASVMLARVRCTRRLLIRLNNEARMELHARARFMQPDAPGKNPLASLPKLGQKALEKAFLYEETSEFQGEEVGQVDPENKRREYETKKLCKEIKERLAQLDHADEAYSIYLMAQARATSTLLEHFSKAQDWSRLPDSLLERIESAYLYYHQARAAGDRVTALSILGYLRFFKTLQRRISAPLPRRELLRKIEVALKIH